MNNLSITKSNGQYAIDSREVAEMIEVRHSDLLEKINGYVTHLLNGKFRSVEFFIIDEDKKLREIYSKIVSEYFIKYVA
jgi:phage regulator Rha-like protein